MKTTKRGDKVEFSVTMFSKGDDWSRFVTRSDSDAVEFNNSAGLERSIERDLATTSMAQLSADGWDVLTETKTMPAWAV